MGGFFGQVGLSALRLQTPALICEIVLWPLMVLILFRMFSKNLTKRRAENQKFVNWWWGVKSRNAGAKARPADKDHKYFTCIKKRFPCGNRFFMSHCREAPGRGGSGHKIPANGRISGGARPGF